MLTRTLLFAAAVALALAGCANSPAATPAGLPATPAPVALTPYQTVTPSPLPTGAPATPTAIPTPTATPRTYTVARGDDLWGISLRYQVPLEVILTANPTVDPNFLSVGTELRIPAVALTPTPGVSTPTPVPVETLRPDCYAEAGGGVWCFLLVKNTQSQAVENLSGAVLLSAGAAAELSIQPAYPPLDLLPAGEALPLVAYFPPPVAQPFAADGQLYTALLSLAAGERYLPVDLAGQVVNLAPDQLSARVTGEIGLPASATGSARARLLAVAYASDGRVAGVRQWEAAEGLLPGQSLPFDLTVYSLGPEIAEVKVMAQANPAAE